MIRGLQKDSVSKEDIIRKYWPLPAIIIMFFNDYAESDPDKKFLKKYIIENNQAEMLTGETYVIPPKGFPERFEAPHKVGRREIEDWIEQDILDQQKKPQVAICQASAVDLRRVYSYTDYDSHGFNRKTIGQAIDIEKILSEHNVHRILASNGVNLSCAIEEGNLPFLLARYVSDEELEDIHENQKEIRERLDNPPLRRVATPGFEKELASVLSDYIDSPGVVAGKAVEEASLWHKEI
ncbi:hypothetical protein [Halarchaeum salinum]|uniref:Uncharacterized protein n=1 Tax=Halarchaeum salinum TaxID=489912 RepID=A0AAV3S9E7_9EURY